METHVTKESVISSPLCAQQQIGGDSAKADAAVMPHASQRVRWRLIAVALVAVVGAAGGWYFHYDESTTPQPQGAVRNGSLKGRATLGFTSDSQSDATNDRPSDHAATVCVEKVSRPSRFGVTGTLVADEQSSVASNTNGIVSEVRVDRGSVVRKGDVLVQLDATDARNRLAEGMALAEELKAKLIWDEASDRFVAEEQPAVKLAEAAVALAASRKVRAEALLPKGAISTEEGEQQRSEFECALQRQRQSLQEVRQYYQAYQTAVARLAALKKAVTDATILAPFDGMIVEKNVAVGEQVTGGFIASKVVTMARINPLRVCLTVPQHSISQIQPGQKVLFYVDSYPGKAFEATVRYISPSVTADTRSLLVEAVAENTEGALRPGLFVTAELELQRQQMELLVPATAVQRTGEVAMVYVIRDGVACGQVVALGEEDHGKIAIRSGLTGTEELLARPELFHDGDQVRR